MADNANKSTDDSAEQKGRAEQEQNEQPNSEVGTKEAPSSSEVSTESNNDKREDETKNNDNQNNNQETTDKNAGSEDDATSAEDSGDKSSNDEADEDDDNKANVEISIELPDKVDTAQKADSDEFQEAVREQIENCKFEIISAVQDNIHSELKDYTVKQIRKIDRRRRTGVIVRDILILILAAIVGYFGYCLYDVKYFSFMKSECERNDTCSDGTDNQGEPTRPEIVVKDTAWYQRNYGYLFDSLKINLNADKVSAYYLYSDDYKVSEIKPNYLLAMAYNRLNSNITYDSDKGIMVPANDLRTSYINLFGNANNFVKTSFTYDCAEFMYDRESDSFITPSMQCNSSSNRQIVEEIDKIYEDGNVMYFLTTAAIYDKAEESFYTFDNLFKPAIKDVMSDELSEHKSLLNHYQYSFKKVDDQYYFSDIIKLD